MLLRINKKFITAKQLLPQPIININSPKSKIGIINFGSTTIALNEAIDKLSSQGIGVNHLRIRAFPFSEGIRNFIETHDFVFILEQNRDAQMKTLMLSEGNINPEKFISVLCFDGAPITADFISESIIEIMSDKDTSKTAEEIK